MVFLKAGQITFPALFLTILIPRLKEGPTEQVLALV